MGEQQHDTDEIPSEQAALWNGPGGQGWVRMQAVMDRLLAPFEDVLVDEAARVAPRRVLDVGCGAGATTFAIARRLGEGATCTGLDISEPLLTAATARAVGAALDVSFVLADAQRHRFEPTTVDLLVSRFGVMFFDDPVAAFTNLRSAMAPDGSLCFVAWRGIDDNPFMVAAALAAAPYVDLPPFDPAAPGQFAFADRARVERILDTAGWGGVDVASLDVTCSMPEADLVPYLTNLGPLGRALAGADDATRAEAIAAVRAAFDPFVAGDEVRFTAGCWLVRAHA